MVFWHSVVLNVRRTLMYHRSSLALIGSLFSSNVLLKGWSVLFQLGITFASGLTPDLQWKGRMIFETINSFRASSIVSIVVSFSYYCMLVKVITKVGFIVRFDLEEERQVFLPFRINTTAALP